MPLITCVHVLLSSAQLTRTPLQDETFRTILTEISNEYKHPYRGIYHCSSVQTLEVGLFQRC